jgi:hypothetical protein
LAALGLVVFTAAVSCAQSGPIAQGITSSDGNNSSVRTQSFWEVIVAEEDRPGSIRFLEPALVPTVQLPAESPAPRLPLFQPGHWTDLQANAEEEKPQPQTRIVEPQFAAPAGQPIMQIVQQEVPAPPPSTTTQEVIPVPPSAEEIIGAPITSLSTDIRVKENPKLKDDLPPSQVPTHLLPQTEMSYVMHRPGSIALCYAWDAPLTNNNPLYFEETNLERHGYSLRYLRAAQPLVSGAEFFATIPTLPYQLTALPPCECIYTLGEYRPGSCVPYQINYPPWSTADGIVEAGTAVGLAFLIP